MTTTQTPSEHIASLIADLTARAANATGKEKAELESAIKYYQGARPGRR